MNQVLCNDGGVAASALIGVWAPSPSNYRWYEFFVLCQMLTTNHEDISVIFYDHINGLSHHYVPIFV
jgi:hypothetical protein